MKHNLRNLFPAYLNEIHPILKGGVRPVGLEEAWREGALIVRVGGAEVTRPGNVGGGTGNTPRSPEGKLIEISERNIFKEIGITSTRYLGQHDRLLRNIMSDRNLHW